MIQHLDRRCDIPPTPPTNLLVGAARPDLVVIGHIDIKDEFTADGL
jgi:hypothetical protein